MANLQTAESKNSQFSVARLIVAVGLACCAFGALRFFCQSVHLPVAAFVLLAIVILPAIVLPALIGTWWNTAKVCIMTLPLIVAAGVSPVSAPVVLLGSFLFLFVLERFERQAERRQEDPR